MKQVDTGLTSALWGISRTGRPQVFVNHSWVPVSGVFKHVSSGEAGVWAIKEDDQVLYRAGISHLNPTGMVWKTVGGSLRQVDSGSAGVVYGIDKAQNLHCRGGIQKDLPTGLLWKRIPGSYKHVTCGLRGCWVITRDDKILFRQGVTGSFCKGFVWTPVLKPKKMKYIECGSDGVLWAVAEDGEVWYREGSDDLHPYGKQWKKLNIERTFDMVTSGLNGQYALSRAGYVYHLEGKNR